MMGGGKNEGKEEEKGDEMNPMAAMMAVMMGGQKEGQRDGQKQERNPMAGFMEMMMQGGGEDEASSDAPEEAKKGSAPHPNEAQIEADMASIMAMMGGGGARKMDE